MNKINMTFFRLYLPKIIISAIIIAFLILSPFVLFPKIYALNYSFNKEYEFDFQGVLTLWNVDTFEGGSVSRTTFLEKRTLEFEKQNKGVYISIQNISLEQLKLNLNSGKKPNLITFGIGVENDFCEDLITLSSSYNVREDLLKGGFYNQNLKALPIMLGGYSVISNKEKIFDENIFESMKKQNESLIFSSNESINPLICLAINDITLNSQQILAIDSFDAYDKFINNKFNVLLGTQRDFYRCKNRENNLKGNYSYNFLDGFSDLVQYASIFFSTEKTQKMCEKFLEFLVSENVQKKLANINMFSVLNENIYAKNNDNLVSNFENEAYKNFNDVLLKPLKTINVFTKSDDILTLKNLCKEFVFEGKSQNKSQILAYLT